MALLQVKITLGGDRKGVHFVIKMHLHKVEGGIFRILGRTSVDIIKSGGYKISALDIERVKHHLS